MVFPTRLLQPGEEVLLEARPRLVRLVRPGLLVACVLAGSVATVVVWAGAPIWFGWVLIAAIGLSLLDLVVRVAQWRAESLTVTTQRVVHRSGILRRLGREIPVSNVQSVSYRQGLLQRLLKTGDLLVESAGESSREPFHDVPDPAEVQAAISGAMHRRRTWTPPGEVDPYDVPWLAEPGAGEPANEAWSATTRLLAAAPPSAGPRPAAPPAGSTPAARPPSGPGVPRSPAAAADTDPTPAVGPDLGWVDPSAPWPPAPAAAPPVPAAAPPAPAAAPPAPRADPPEAAGAAAPPPAAVLGTGAPDVVTQIERLAALYERGVLTRDEFESKKAELLARL
jgi:membrane protein YdbS with pleckstrin-like domain